MNTVTVYTPDTLENSQISKNVKNTMSIFLAGTIDMGSSVDWQAEVISLLQESPEGNIIVYNPRRIAAPEDIMSQIDWEQRALECCDLIAMNILETSKSPITLLELGLFARSGKLLVFCPKKFYRYENVLDTCRRFNVEYTNLNTSKNIVSRIKKKLLDRKTLLGI